MSYYWFNRAKLFKNRWNKYHNKGRKQNLLNFILLIKTSLEKMQEISIETCYRKKRIKK